MKALFIVLLIASVLALIPLGVDGGYATEQGPTLRVRIGLFSIGILPKKKKEPKVRKPAKPEKPGKKKKGPPPLTNRGWIKLIKAALRALSQLREKLMVQYLRFRFTVASSDPFKTALSFGYASGAAASFVSLLNGAFTIEEPDIGPSFDFTATKPKVDVWITASILVWQVLYVAAVLLIEYLKIKKQYALAATDKNEKTTDTTDKGKD